MALSLTRRAAGAVLLFFAAVQPVLSIPSTDGAGIFGTTCWAEKDRYAATDECQAAIDNIRHDNDPFAGLSGHKNACVEIGSSGSCVVVLCDVKDETGFVTYGAIAMAAQPIHAACKGNPSTRTTGGFNTLAGMGIPGYQQTIATVEMGKRDFFFPRKLRGRNTRAETTALQKKSLLEFSNPDDPRRISKRVDNDEHEMNVPGTNHVLTRVMWSMYPNFAGEDLSRRDQGILIDRLVANWNAGTGNPTVVTASIEVDGTRYTLEYNAHNNADLNRVATGNRRPLAESFFTLRSRNGNPTMLETVLQVEGGPFLGQMVFQQTNLVPFENEPPIPDNPFADPPGNPYGGDPFAEPIYVFRPDGCM